MKLTLHLAPANPQPKDEPLPPPFFPAMEELIVELRLFLELLDHEYLTSTVREKKAVLTNILLRIQSSSKGES